MYIHYKLRARNLICHLFYGNTHVVVGAGAGFSVVCVRGGGGGGVVYNTIFFN